MVTIFILGVMVGVVIPSFLRAILTVSSILLFLSLITIPGRNPFFSQGYSDFIV